MVDYPNNATEQFPVFIVVDGQLVRKPNDYRDPNKRYSSCSGPDGPYLREFTEEEERQRDEEEARWAAEAPQRELEKKRQEAEAEEFRASLKYETRLVAYVDILGWTEAVKTSSQASEKTQRLGLALTTLKNQVKMAEWQEKYDFPGDLRVTQFSDCLAISTLPDNHGKSSLISLLGFISTGLLYQGFLLRGGITIGEIYHQGSTVFGPAFLKAYDLESNCSVYPRIILDPVLAKQWGQGDRYSEKDGQIIGYARTWRMSHDGYRFFDFLQPFGGSPGFWNSPNALASTLLPLRPHLIEKLKEFSENSRILPKYLWLANYFNDVCNEHIGHNTEPINLSEYS